jgi:hypothetical protein
MRIVAIADNERYSPLSLARQGAEAGQHHRASEMCQKAHG